MNKFPAEQTFPELRHSLSDPRSYRTIFAHSTDLG